MSSGTPQQINLINDINDQLEREGVPLASIARKAVRLASFRNEHEYRMLFALHLSGIALSKSEMEASAIEKWPDKNIKPKWNPFDAFSYDRALEGGNTVLASLEEVEAHYEMLRKQREGLHLQSESQAVLILLKEEKKLGQVIARIRNRITAFVRHAEQELAQEGISGSDRRIEDKQVEQGKEVQDTRNVFVVNGRDLEARNSLFRFLRSIELKPIEWSQAIKLTGKASPFIGEILDVAFSKAQAVVVLMTPDDVAQLQEMFRSPHDPPYEAQLTGQARPNVLFEAGMAMGRNPDRTVIVELGPLRPFSDIAGRHTVKLSNDTKARQELAQRLETAGCPVDLSGRDWHTEGNFDFNVQAEALELYRDSSNQVDAHDRRLFTRFLAALPSRGKEVRFLRDHDVGVDFPSNMLDHFYDFIERWGNAEHEFNNSELEQRRLEFWNALNRFLRELGQYTSETRGGWLSIGLKDMGNRDEMLEAHPRLNDLGTKAYEAHQNLVRAGRRVGISVAPE